MTLFSRDQIVCIVLMLPYVDEPLFKRVPRAFSRDSKGAVSIDGKAIIVDLFGIPKDQLEKWMKQTPKGLQFWFHGVRDSQTGKELAREIDPSGEPVHVEEPNTGLSLWLCPEVNSIREAVRQVIRSLMRSGFSAESLKQFKYYALANEDLNVYVVIMGNIANPPSHLIVGQVQP